MKIQSNKSWYKAIFNVNPILYESSLNNPLTTIPLNNSSESTESVLIYDRENLLEQPSS